MEPPVCVNVDLGEFLELDNLTTEIQWKCPEYAVKMLEEAVYADITFEVAEGDSVKAHRNVLASVSRVFGAMFRHDMKKKLTASVQISDMSIDALKLFLLLLYTTKDEHDVGIPELNSAIDKHFKEFHEAVMKYEVEGVLRSLHICALARNLTPENCWIHLDQSHHYGSISFSTCRDYIVGNYEEVIESSCFLNAMKFNPVVVCLMVREASRKRKRIENV